MNTTRSMDAVIAGGGIAGLCCAALLARAGARVTVLEPALDGQPPDGPMALRNYAITPASQAVLASLAVWDDMRAERIAPFHAIEVWDRDSSGRTRFDPPYGAAAMGWIVEHQNLLAALTRALSRASVTIIAERLVALEPGPPAMLRLDNDRQLSADLVVAADGAQSALRDLLGIAFARQDYGQRAVVANVRSTQAHGGIARQRFLGGGPLAFLPLPQARDCSIVWSCPDALAVQLEGLDDARFAARLAEAFEQAPGSLELLSERAWYPLERARAGAFVCGSVALVGDAAHVIHPLAGQGLNLGLMDAAALAECVAAPAGRTAWPRQRDLRRYERWRKSEACALGTMTHALQRVFALDAEPLRVARGLGMQIADRASMLNHWLAGHAMGTRGDLPQICTRHTASQPD